MDITLRSKVKEKETTMNYFIIIYNNLHRVD